MKIIFKIKSLIVDKFKDTANFKDTASFKEQAYFSYV
jgi:hypothetical protein